MAGPLADRDTAPLRGGAEPLERLAHIDHGLGHEKRIDVERLVVLEGALLRVRYGRAQRLLDLLRGQLLSELEDGVGLIHVLAPNEFAPKPHLPRALPDPPLDRLGFCWHQSSILSDPSPRSG